MSELVNQCIGYRDETESLHFLRAGAQTVFGKSVAERLLKKLGPPWMLMEFPKDVDPSAFSCFFAHELRKEL